MSHRHGRSFLSVLKGIVQCFIISFIFNDVANGLINLSSLVVLAFCGRQYVACLNYGSLIVLCLARVLSGEHAQRSFSFADVLRCLVVSCLIS